jgi:hypothetical protein
MKMLTEALHVRSSYPYQMLSKNTDSLKDADEKQILQFSPGAEGVPIDYKSVNQRICYCADSRLNSVNHRVIKHSLISIEKFVVSGKRAAEEELVMPAKSKQKVLNSVDLVFKVEDCKDPI